MFHWLWRAVKTILWVLLKIITLGAIGVAIYEIGKDIWAFLKTLVGRLPDPAEDHEPPAIAPPPFSWIPQSHEGPGAATGEVGQKGFDVDRVLDTASLDDFYSQGFRFVLRYVRNINSATEDHLTKKEATAIRLSGFALMPVQHAHSPGWQPTQQMGQEDGALAVQQVIDCDLPTGICVWLDLQDVNGDTAASDTIGYCNAWFTEVSNGGYRPGLYVGANCGLTQDQIDGQLPFAYYWRAGSEVPDLPGHGYCIVQTIDSRFVAGSISYDLDTIVAEGQSEPPVWATPLAAPAPPSSLPVPIAPPPPPPTPAPIPLPPMNAGTAVAVVGQKGFDGDTVMNSSSLDAFYAQGFRFAVRYVRNTNSSTSANLSEAEAQTIRSAGFALMPVQHVRGKGWHPTGTLGQQDGALAVQQVIDCGLPKRICVWLDLEAVSGEATASDVLAYCSAWFTEVSNAGYLPGIYVGADCGLTQDQLDDQLPFEYYWRSGSTVPSLPNHGYCMVQTIDSDFLIGGVSYDLDTITADGISKPPVWAAPLPAK